MIHLSGGSGATDTAEMHPASSLLDAIPASVAILDHHGIIQSANLAWRTFAHATGGVSSRPETGIDYLAACRVPAAGSLGTSAVVEGLRSVLDGGVPRFEYEYPCHSPAGERWFRLLATPLLLGGRIGAFVMHVDITRDQPGDESLREADKPLRIIVEETSDTVSVKDRRGWYPLVNASGARALGRDADTIIGGDDTDLVPSESAEVLMDHDRLVTTQRTEHTFEEIIRVPEGTTIRLTSETPFHVAPEAVADLSGTGRDVTRRKADEEALSILQRQQAALLDNITDMAWLKDVDSRFIAVNEALARACGRPRAEIIGRSDADIWPPAVAAKFMADDRVVLERGERIRIEESFRKADGSVVSIETIKTPFRGATGAWAGTAGIGRDISERRRAEFERDQFFTQMHDAVFVAGFDGLARRINPAFTRTFGWSAEQVLALPWDAFIHRDDREAALAMMTRLATSQEAVAFECRCRCEDGSFRWVHWNATPWLTQELFYATCRDITERRNGEEALRASEARLRSALDAAELGFWDWNVLTGSMTFLGPPGVLFGPGSGPFDGTYEGFLSCVHPEDREALNRAMVASVTRRSDYSHEFRRVWPDGSVRWIASRGKFQFDEAGQATRMLAAVMDVTDRKMLEQQLVQAQKLEAIGQLAAGIAHEINTPTQYVGDNLRFLAEGFELMLDLLQQAIALLAEPAVRRECAVQVALIEERARAGDIQYMTTEIPRAVQQSLEGVGQIAEIVRAMKDFAHSGSAEMRQVDLNRSIENTVTVTRNEWRYTADVVMQCDPTLPPVPCHPGEIQQVILNLIVNAAHAIADRGEDAGKGTITVSTAWTEEVVEIRVADTGTGIPEQVRPRIFDPFFTTKGVGRGTGQGLAIARDVVVKKHQGTLTFETRDGEGTTFLVRLPLRRSPAPAGAEK